MRRRDFLLAAVAGGVGASLGSPAFLRRAWAQGGPIKIGMPAALSGGNAQYGIQAKRAAELFAKDIKAKGGSSGGPSSSSTRTRRAIPPPPCARRRSSWRRTA